MAATPSMAACASTNGDAGVLTRKLQEEGIKGPPDAGPSFYALHYLGEIRDVVARALAGDPLACVEPHIRDTLDACEFDVGGRFGPVPPNTETFPTGMPIVSLGGLIQNWPDFNEDGLLNQVWIGDGRGHTRLVTQAGPLNKRLSPSGAPRADLLLDFDVTFLPSKFLRFGRLHYVDR